MFMAVIKKCLKCGENYLPSYQSPNCPHESTIPNPILTTENGNQAKGTATIKE